VTVLLRLRRRAARVVLVMAEGPVRAGIQELLRQHGYHRLDTIAHMGLLRPLCDPGQRQALPALILADLALAHSGDAEPLAAVRTLERQIAELGGPAAAILCEEVDPTLLLAQETPTRFLPYPADHGDRWVETLDGMLQP
jgi:DNA-binding NarL/FixJ family response regulator